MAGQKTLAPNGDQRAESLSWLYMMLFLPFGISSGFVSVALAYGLAQAHVPTVAIAGLMALPFAVLSWKVLWAPIVDCVWTYRGWHLASSLVVALGVLVQGLIPMTEASLPVAAVVVFLTTVASTGVGMATSGLMAHAVSPARQGEAAGWCQAGNLGGSGIGGGLGLWLTQHAGGMPVAGIIVALTCVLSTLALIPLIEPEQDHRAPRMIDTGRKVVKDLLSWSRKPGQVAKREFRP
jgi:MFS family permease